MQRLILSLLICLGFVLPATAQAWWQDDWVADVVRAVQNLMAQG